MSKELNVKHQVLDHGLVRLVDFMGDDTSVVRAARVSYDAAWRAGEDKGSDNNLIKYLWKHHHTTPFEAVTFTFEIKAPIFILRQWHRHRTQSYNELSARYKELPTEYYLPDPGIIGKQALKNKQGRDDVLLTGLELRQRQSEVQMLKNHCEEGFRVYNNLIALEWPRELARSALAVNTYSHMFATMNLLNLLKFLTLRYDSHAQYEIQQYANAMRDIAKSVVPVCMQAWENNLPQQKET